ncbi:hypothetical protein BLA50215_01041 [Burkholderia lata]|nr:hypothetical protein BLA50215_01041 [Burkholderia lata]
MLFQVGERIIDCQHVLLPAPYSQRHLAGQHLLPSGHRDDRRRQFPRVKDLARQTLGTEIPQHPTADVFEGQRRLVGKCPVILPDVRNDDLIRCQPRREPPFVVLQEDADEPFGSMDGPEFRISNREIAV